MRRSITCGSAIMLLISSWVSAGTPKSSVNKEVEMIGSVVRARQDYRRSLVALKAYFSERGDLQKLAWAERELADLDRVSQYMYRIEAEVAGPDLKAILAIPEADEWFEMAMDYKKADRFNPFRREANYKKAATLFTRIVREHPDSNKIDEAAYQLGDIYESSVFKDYFRAAMWFERVGDWNPGTTTDARFRAAKLFQDKLHDRQKALALFQEVLDTDTSETRIRIARQRLQKLAGQPLSRR